jgi:hypothetical protein
LVHSKQIYILDKRVAERNKRAAEIKRLVDADIGDPEDPRPEKRRDIVAHPNAPSEELDRLAGDVDLTVRQVVAEHQNVSNRVLAKLVKSRESKVRRAAAANKKPRLCAELFESWPNTPTRQTVERSFGTPRCPPKYSQS